MKKPESFCTACEWQGDGTGLSACPVCGQPITNLDVETESSNEEYSPEVLKKTEKEEDVSDI